MFRRKKRESAVKQIASGESGDCPGTEDDLRNGEHEGEGGGERECKWCRACRMLCGLQDGVHANGGTQPYCYLDRAAGRAQRSISVMYMYSQVALKWDGGGQKQEKPCGQSRALNCMKTGLQNLISLTALTAGFERVWVVGSTETDQAGINILQKNIASCNGEKTGALFGRVFSFCHHLHSIGSKKKKHIVPSGGLKAHL